MPLFAYNRDIPDGPNNPSVDQPKMKVNTNSTDDLIDVDHYSFGENNGGLHRQVSLVTQASPALLGNVEIYSALNATIDVPTIKNSFIDQPMISGLGVSTSANGYTSMLGGVIIQWGFVDGTHDGVNHRFNNADQGNVIFPVPFTPGTGFCFGVQTSIAYNFNPPAVNVPAVVVEESSVTTTGFSWTFLINGTSVFSRFYWWAIGF